ncbi:MAG: GH25 family lysozyme [Eubacteriales bacterium]
MRTKKNLMILLVSVIAIISASAYFAFSHTAVDAASFMPSAGTAYLKVVDISEWNDSVTSGTDNINFTSLKTQVDAVYIRSFGHTGNILTIDKQAVNYANSAQRVNLNYGFYYYYIPKKADPADARAQAQSYYNFIRSFAYSCVPVLDVEDNSAGLTKAELAASIKVFADEFKALSGTDVMIYTYPGFMKSDFDTSYPWSSYKLWIAHYNVPAPMSGISSSWMPESMWCWSRWDMWQYTSTGSLSSIPNSSGGWLDMSTATDNILMSTPTAVTNVDSPSKTYINGGEITISGWALSHAGVDRVDFYVDDNVWVGSTSNMLERPDVQQAMNSNGRYNDGLHSGFSYIVPAGFFADGQHTLKIAVINRDGTVKWTSHIFTVGEVTYQSHVQDVGWQVWASDGTISGTVDQSKRLEAMHIQLIGQNGGIEYRTHVQDIGWMGWVANGALSGTSGQSKRLEAIQIRLTGAIADRNDVYYRVYAQNNGWLDWAKNGDSSGTAGFGYRLEAIEVKLVAKGSAAPGATAKPFVDLYAPKAIVDTVSYQTHVQDIGWQAYVSNGALSGTIAQSKRLEAIHMKLENMAGGIEYRTHVQDIGWMDWAVDDALSGTSGQSKRLEAIQIRLTGAAADRYDIYYCVHAQNTGWLDWAKNGEPAGTAGFSYRLEAIKVVLVPKGSAAPGSTARPFIQG